MQIKYQNTHSNRKNEEKKGEPKPPAALSKPARGGRHNEAARWLVAAAGSRVDVGCCDVRSTPQGARNTKSIDACKGRLGLVYSRRGGRRAQQFTTFKREPPEPNANNPPPKKKNGPTSPTASLS